MEFIHTENQIGLYDENHKLLAEVTFPTLKEGVVQVNHTFVDASLRGQGIANQLMLELVKELQDTDRKAVPTCSYAVSWFETHPEYQDILAL